MGSVFKQKVTRTLPANAELFERKGQRLARWIDGKGKTRTAKVTEGADGALRIQGESAYYSARFRDGFGHVVTIPTGCRDKSAALAILNERTGQAEKVRAGIINPREEAIGNHNQTPIDAHIAGYIAHLGAKQVTQGHKENVQRSLERVINDCGFSRLFDLDRTALERWLVAREREGMSARSRNAYVAAIIGFCNWCVESGRMASNPLKGLHKASEKADPRRQRRALSESELISLLEAAERRPLNDRLKNNRGESDANLSPETRDKLIAIGRERALIYKTLFMTGLRRGELESITAAQVSLDGDAPYIVLNAADEKNRKGARIPLRADLAAELREPPCRQAGSA